jgi:hypothetical protein
LLADHPVVPLSLTMLVELVEMLEIKRVFEVGLI